jgi:ribosomal protein S18 acetylase RimI-like enzyme
METINIRKARLDDLDVLLEFEQAVIASERPFDPTLKPKTNYYNIEGMITADHIELLVAEIDDKIVGSGYARIEEAQQFLNHRQFAYLGFMYTIPAYRGRGINRKIIEALINWSSLKGITEIRLEVYYLNDAAIRAYEKAGFSRHMIEMRMEAGKSSG